jgi:hypothetical protein
MQAAAKKLTTEGSPGRVVILVSSSSIRPLSGGALDATFGGSLLPLARIVSLDWACGLMLGVPVGLGWAGAMLDERSADRE